ncbi:glycosyltransferase [Tianweitania sp. BSSL-BM11]|uniref:Glycosyltransferase n=1 Tax=Tianweitania aestuarii TaxID=2814886 RepID=A0ABS5RR40_9HYPH|nr:glycosyltransferase [Tianweitania aestuarii]MBS9719422.1 glycosyltransferase [Tianweitania aestuarii]
MNASGILPGISLVARSPHPVEGIEAVVICPTFRRPDHVLKTLQSLKAQETVRRFAVIIMENEAEGREGAAVAAPLFEAGDMQGMVVIAHDRGNCCAYNAGLQTALQHYPDFRHVLIIDDDEVADIHWVERMIAAADRFGADLVGGPQHPVFVNPGKSRFEKHPVFKPTHQKSGLVPVLYSSGNLLIGKHVLQALDQPFFDPRFNFLGGGDSDLLSRCAAKGFKLAWCEEACVYETVPERRLQADWIRARSLRNGVISTLVEKRKRAEEPFGEARTFAKSTALLAAAPFRAARDVAKGSVVTGQYRLYIALGRVLAHFGYQNEQYRQPEKN